MFNVRRFQRLQVVPLLFQFLSLWRKGCPFVERYKNVVTLKSYWVCNCFSSRGHAAQDGYAVSHDDEDDVENDHSCHHDDGWYESYESPRAQQSSNSSSRSLPLHAAL